MPEKAVCNSGRAICQLFVCVCVQTATFGQNSLWPRHLARSYLVKTYFFQLWMQSVGWQPAGTHMHFIEWCYIQWSWLTP